MPEIKHIIFDCDGVLIDSEMLSLQVWITLLAEYHISIDSHYFSENFLGRSFEHVKSVIDHDFNFTMTQALRDEFALRLKQAFTQDLQTTPHIESILSRLTVPYSLATSSSRPRTKIALNVTGLDRYFSEAQIFTASDVKHGKPAPDLFLHTATSCHVLPQHCLVIEDSQPGIQAAQAAHMQWRHYSGGSHLKQSTGNPKNSLADWRDFPNSFPQLVE
jgi:HAD superfamily hydrolase (TIGR01509 family)